MGTPKRAGWLVAIWGVTLAAGMQMAPSAAASPITDWGARALEPATEIRDTITAMKTSGDASNLRGVKAACLQLQDSAADLRSLLPAPSEALTNEVSEALSELRMAIRPCLKMGPSDRPGGRQITPSDNDISTYEMHLDKAIAHMETAKSMVEQG
jgi:hypothetical protein